ncbi:hypothetical protein OZX74_04700 [Bifidobacterium sp. ESL0798]|uniref:hypothetical protein n=1 Tax=Bifidobacterium sp. ESL0798 TaxID=2983235 RepID=UPI0023F7441F|nr:hypothetical protein [Bifidobacterium sp. ESL0798]WEV74806.1 hypothetical protein OZX74_04700 [Bifidobacterium sp. ESL0798]
MMGSLSCMLNPGPGGGAYHAGGMEPDLSGPGGAASQRDRSAEAASWGGDVASGAGGRADWNADMDAINLSHYIQAHPKVDRQEAVRDYYAQLSKGNLERNRIRQFCGNYDPRNEGDPQRGLDYLKENGLYIATGSAEGQYLGAGIGEDKQRATLKDFLDMLRKGMG